MKSKIDKLSAIIIAKNEEKNIIKCLESLLNVIDDIVVIVDSTSTDNTYNIAKSYNVNCIIAEWQGYAKTKAFAVNHTKYNWVLWIDADEELTAELKQELILLKNSETDYAAYEVARKAFFLNREIKHCGWYPGYVIRLFNKTLCNFNEIDVHEHLIVNGKLGRLKNDLYHYTDPNIKHYYDKFNSYTSLAANMLNQKGKKAKLSDLIIRPIFLFFKMYFLRLGFLDGYAGLILSVFSANYVFTKYAKLWELNNLRNK